MNLDSNDIELIRQTVRAEIGQATERLVKEETFKDFRSEVLAAQQQFVNREVFALELKARDEEIERLWAEVKESKNVLKSLWSSAWGRVVSVAAGILTLAALWELFVRQ